MKHGAKGSMVQEVRGAKGVYGAKKGACCKEKRETVRFQCPGLVSSR